MMALSAAALFALAIIPQACGIIFQRGSWDYHFSPDKIEHVRRVIHRYLRKADEESRKLIASLTVGIIAAYAVIWKVPSALDVALVLALVGFLAAVAFSRYLEKRGEEK